MDIPLRTVRPNIVQSIRAFRVQDLQDAATQLNQHFLYAKLRAIETRRWVVRSANTGISGFINQRGDIVKQSKWWTRDALKMDINLNDQMTAYVKSGDIIAQILSIVGLVLALFIPYYTFFKKKAAKQ